MGRKHGSQLLGETESGRRRCITGGSLAVLGVLLIAAAFHPMLQSTVLHWVPVGYMASCPIRPDCDHRPGGEAEVEPWGVSDAERWTERRKAGHSVLGHETTDCEASANCSDCNQTIRAVTELLPGVGLLPAGSNSLTVPDQVVLLKRLYARQLGLSEDRLRAAVSYGGNPERLHRVLQKLIRGRPVNIATIGGSVTAGVGADTPNLSYRERLFEWIRDTFPNENHTFANGALPAAPSSYIHQCIMDFAPHNTDLAIIEFTMNDSQRQCGVDSDGRRGFEVLIRKLLAYKHKPALIVLHWWSPQTRDFWQSAEDELEVFSKYYGLPSLSWRDAAHDLLANNVSGFTFEDIYHDKGHPNGYNGHRYLSDMLIGLLRNEAALMLLTGKAGDPIKSARELKPVPEPMLPGNYEGKSECMRGKAFRNVVIEESGWDWKDEGRSGRHKWGFISWTPGARLVLKVNTRTYRGSSKILVGVGMLTSYERMGMASLQCESGCECDPVLMDGHTDDQFSQSGWFYHSVSQHEECIISITNANETRDPNGEHKFKVSSFLVTNLHNSSAKWFLHIDQLAEKAAASERYLAAAKAAAAAEQQPEAAPDGGSTSMSEKSVSVSAPDGEPAEQQQRSTADQPASTASLDSSSKVVRRARRKLQSHIPVQGW